ncbi:hypothetical protein JL475_36455 [Streptomyces sp. M2CJ-2]|uniref:uracil phosphoribosyltransferase n=1 Tax=Streptomyces sp. M2CJ-2 TaxID=2803948 RepID=UPI001927AB3B|nr:uracil phosphoribosyltransferase [Streptomyces sp. M2CJ-2]MBL3671305.1 hypothetical protein [Streptomyces sp. M2CJ-2]
MTTVGNVALLPQTNRLRAMHTVIRDKDAFRRDFAVSSRRTIRLPLEAGLELLPFEFPASPQGLECVSRAAPAVRIVTPAVEDGLSEHAFTVPGTGDFGDRFSGTLPRAGAS